MRKWGLLLVVILNCIISCSHPEQPKPDLTKEKIIGVQPFSGFDAKLADTAAKEIEKAYGIKTVTLNPVDLPANAFTSIKSPRYRADSLIRFLRKEKTDSLYTIIGLTHKDISITKKDAAGNIKSPQSKYIDFGIFGLGYCPGPACVVSTYRYQHSEKAIFYDRFFKICKHEIGHNLGLPHCSDKTCVMQDAAENIKTIDQAGIFLCEKCKEKIR